MTALALCRFAHFLAAMLAFGMSAYLWAYAPQRLRLALSPIIRRLTLIASILALITAIAWLVLESASMVDEWSAAVDPGPIGAVLTDTAFGHIWALHLALAVTLVAVVAVGPRAHGRRPRSYRRRCWQASASSAMPRCRRPEGVLHRANHAVHLMIAGRGSAASFVRDVPSRV